MSPDVVVPLAGPLDEWPDVRSAEAWLMLDSALSGLPMGSVDARAQLRLAELDSSMVAVVASLLRRSWTAGVESGRAERVDEQPAVLELRAKVSDSEAEIQRAHGVEREDAERIADLESELAQERAEVGRLSREVGRRERDVREKVSEHEAELQRALGFQREDANRIVGLESELRQARAEVDRLRAGGAL